MIYKTAQGKLKLSNEKPTETGVNVF